MRWDSLVLHERIGSVGLRASRTFPPCPNLSPHFPAPRMPLNIALVQKSWVTVRALGPAAGELFYKNLFEMSPEAKPLFANVDKAAQSMKLMDSLHFAVGKLNDLPTLVPVLKKMGARHIKYGTLDAHYPLVGAALLHTLSMAMGKDWTPETKTAWTKVYGIVADTMMEGAREAEAAALK